MLKHQDQPSIPLAKWVEESSQSFLTQIVGCDFMHRADEIIRNRRESQSTLSRQKFDLNSRRKNPSRVQFLRQNCTVLYQ